MKWLFAVLVALNVIVFGAVVSIQISRKTERAEGGKAPVAEASKELSVPAAAVAQKKDEAPPAWIKTGDNASAPEPTVDETHIPTEKTAEQKLEEEKARLEREKKQLAERLKKEAEQKAKKTREQAEGGALFEPDAPVAKSNGRENREGACTRSVSVAIPEDDYHRIKGLLAQWPHAASRRVEQRDSKEQNGDGSASIAKMQIFFSGLSDADIRSVQGVVGRYGRLQRGSCR